MSFVVKKWRSCRPRARWKIEAPCMIVLSTSKKAAALGSGGVASDASTSALDAAASPAITERERSRAGGSDAGAGAFTRHSVASSEHRPDPRSRPCKVWKHGRSEGDDRGHEHLRACAARR